QRVRGQARPADREVAAGRPLHPPDGLRVEVALDPRARRRRGRQRARVDDLVGGPPDLSVVAHDVGLGGDVHRLPDRHGLVHAAAVEMRPEVALEVVDEGVHLGVRCGPAEVARLVGGVAVEGGDRGEDQAGHAAASETRTSSATLSAPKRAEYGFIPKSVWRTTAAAVSAPSPTAMSSTSGAVWPSSVRSPVTRRPPSAAATSVERNVIWSRRSTSSSIVCSMFALSSSSSACIPPVPCCTLSEPPSTRTSTCDGAGSAPMSSVPSQA